VDILLFDEPLANLDPATGKTAIEIIDEIHRRSGKTIIIIEHRLEDVLHCEVDRIILIHDGHILADMDPHRLVSSDLLVRNGIREPLYVTALKYSNVQVTPDIKPGHIWSLNVKAVKKPICDWYHSVEPEIKKKKAPLMLSLQDINFSYDGLRLVLQSICIDICEGEMLSIIGRNGAGKTTLAKLLCGFVKEDSGVVLYQGSSIRPKSIKERAEFIGYVMQNPNQMVSKTMIFDEVALGLRLRHVPEEEIQSRVEKALKVCGLLPFIKWPISCLSWGQKKRVTIASILVLEPHIIILDEPTAGQDFRHYTEFMRFLAEINKLGVTIILITHDMHLMLEYTPRSIALSEGRKLVDTSASSVLTDLEIIKQANLKETSLYYLAQMVGIEDEARFVQRFIDYEKQVRK